MDQEIEEAVRACTVCQNVRNIPPSAPLIPWKWPTRPFQRVHIDFSQTRNDHFFVVIDSHSKWIEVQHMTSTNAERTIDELRLIFATHGLPEEVASDNGPQFTSTNSCRKTALSTPWFHPTTLSPMVQQRGQ